MARQHRRIEENGHVSGTRPRYVLGRYQEFSPGPELADFVQCTWRFSPQAGRRGDAPLTHLVLPDPGVDLAFSCRRDANGICVDAALEFMGSVNQPREFKPRDHIEIVAVKFHPDAVLPVLKIRPRDHSDRIAEFAGLNTAMASDVFPKLAESRSWSEALKILVDAARRKVTSGCVTASPIQQYAAAVRAAPSANPIQWAAEQSSISERQMRRAFDQEFGIPPKRFSRILRLLRIMRAADSLARPSWAWLAAEFGYSDQAHLINESHALVGDTPAALHRARRAQIADFRAKRAVAPDLGRVESFGPISGSPYIDVTPEERPECQPTFSPGMSTTSTAW